MLDDVTSPVLLFRVLELLEDPANVLRRLERIISY